MPEYRAAIDIDATRDVVFEFLVTDEGLTAWMGDWALLEPQRGGSFAVNIAGYRARGSFLEVDRPRRVVVSWGFVESETLPPGASTVAFELSETHDGTRVEVIHTDLPEGEVAGHADGWTHFLPRLIKAVAGEELPPDTWSPNPASSTSSRSSDVHDHS